MLTSLPLSTDAEVTTMSQDHYYWLVSGRWAAYLITITFPPHLVPYLTLAIFGACAAVAYRLLLSACRLEADWRAYLTFPIFCGFPIWMFILEFSSNAAHSGVALLLTTASVWLMSERFQRKRPVVRAVCELALLTVAVSIYQAFALVYGTLLIAWLLLRADGGRWRMWEIYQAVAVLASACVLSGAIGRLFNYLFGVPPGYLDQFIRLDLLLGAPMEAIRNTLDTMVQAYAGSSYYYGANLSVAGAVVIAAILAVLLQRSAWSAFLLLSLLVAPFGFLVLAGGVGFPPRALLAIPVAMWAMSMVLLKTRRTAQPIWAAVIVALAVQSVAMISSYEAVRRLRSDRDTKAAAQIYYRASELVEAGQPKKIDFFGAMTNPEPLYPVNPYSTAGASLFSWDTGIQARMFAYLKILGYKDLVALKKPEREAMIPEFEGMPTWPAAGSVKLVDGVVLVKLGAVAGRY